MFGILLRNASASTRFLSTTTAAAFAAGCATVNSPAWNHEVHCSANDSSVPPTQQPPPPTTTKQTPSTAVAPQKIPKLSSPHENRIVPETKNNDGKDFKSMKPQIIPKQSPPSRPHEHRVAPIPKQSSPHENRVVEKKNNRDGKDVRSMKELILKLALRERRVFLAGRVDDEMALHIVATLLWLEHDSPGTPISMNINSSGGSVHAGLAIHDAMDSISSPVHTLCLGHCESIAALVLAGGERGERSAMPHARIVIHQPVRYVSGIGEAGSGAKMNARQLQINAASIDESRMKLVRLLARKMGRSVAEVESLLEYDTVCDTQKAIRLGLIDKCAPPDIFASKKQKQQQQQQQKQQ